MSDFGLSKWKNFSRSNTNAGHIGGTTSHMPPEKLKDINYQADEKLDVYSFSILLWELFTEREAFKDNEASIIRRWVTGGERLSLKFIPSEVPKEIHTLIKSCWNQKAKNRPPFCEIKEKLNTLVSRTTNEMVIKEAKEKVVMTLHKLSSSEACADHVQKLKQRQQQLCEFIRRINQILSSLREKCEVTQQEYEQICSQPTDYETINLLIIKLCDKPVSAYQTFLTALHDSNQQYLVSLLQEKDYDLKTDHKSILLDNTTYLKKNIVLSPPTILDHLLEADVLDDHEVQKIISKDTNDEKVHQLLHYIMRTSRDQYLLFLESLNKASHEFVYDKLKGETSKDIPKIDFINALERLAVLHVIPGTQQRISGITVLHGDVFVVRESSQVYVYKSDNFTLIRALMIIGSKELGGIIACSHYNCLFAVDPDQGIIYRYDLTSNITTSWVVGGKCLRLYLTKCHNILATQFDTKRMQEYTTHGSLVREISLDDSIVMRRHCIQQENGNYVVCHLGTHNRICIVDQSGRIIHSYGRRSGAGIGQLNFPCHLLKDVQDNILVADSENNRVQLLSPTLTYVRDIVVPGYRLHDPAFLHFDDVSHRLYVGEWDGRRVLVLQCQ